MNKNSYFPGNGSPRSDWNSECWFNENKNKKTLKKNAEGKAADQQQIKPTWEARSWI